MKIETIMGGLHALKHRVAARTSGGNKMLCDYSMGYKLKLYYENVCCLHDTRQHYDGRGSKYAPTHPEVQVWIERKELMEGIKEHKINERSRKRNELAQKLKSRKDFRAAQKRAKRERKERIRNILNGSHRPLVEGYAIYTDAWAVTGLTLSEAVLYIADKRMRSALSARRNEALRITHCKAGDSMWYIGGVGLERKSYAYDTFPHTRLERQRFCNEIFEKDPETNKYFRNREMRYFLSNERNEERKRMYAERNGGWEMLLPEVAAKVSEGSDGVKPITLYSIGGVKYLLVTDHSTERQYALCPPDQTTNDAVEAWRSTFPVSITYRQGDVGISYCGSEVPQILEFQS